MPSQRACDAENQARYTLSNGPLRVQRNAFYAQSILQRVGIRQLPGDMMVSPPSARVTVNSRWHRGLCRTCYTCTLFVLDRSYHSVKDVFLWDKNSIPALEKVGRMHTVT